MDKALEITFSIRTDFEQLSGWTPEQLDAFFNGLSKAVAAAPKGSNFKLIGALHGVGSLQEVKEPAPDNSAGAGA